MDTDREAFYAAVRERIERRLARSAWVRGVRAQAHDLLDELEENDPYNAFATDPQTLKENALNGAKDWEQYSHVGCASS